MPSLRQELDWPLVLAVLTLMGIGVAAIFSATSQSETGRLTGMATQQMVWVFLAIIAMAGSAWIPQKTWTAAAYPLFGASLFLLLIVLAAGTIGMGATRWIVIGPIRFQPSELTKFTMILALARFLSGRLVNVAEFGYIMKTGLFAVFPLALVMQQPDLGTALVYIAVFTGMIYWGGMRRVHLMAAIVPAVNVACALAGIIPWAVFVVVFAVALAVIRPSLPATVGAIVVNVAVGVATPALWNGLAPYQRKRILTLFDPESDPLGAGYQIIQSKVAIGSGGVWGRGWLQGSQTQLAYLPERHTDFIFSVIGEEFGLVGASIVLGLLFVVLWRGIVIAKMVHNPFTSFVCIGIVVWLAFHTVVNVGMTVGLMPVVGLPLPLVSYGGSALVTTGLALGTIVGARIRRLEH